MSGLHWLTAPGERGTYVLRIAIEKAVRLSLGRFRGGAPLDFPAGTYLYVGSARGRNGLARRLLRHATRVQGLPHTLRPALVQAFRLPPPQGKRLHWHIDYLLESPRVNLDAVYLWAEPDAPVERDLSRWLSAHPGVSIPFGGVGASDDPGGTHLLRVPAPPEGWSGLLLRFQG